MATVIHQCDDRDATARAAADGVAALAAAAIGTRGRFTVALAGGSTPRALYRALAQGEHDRVIDWDRVECFWGDERTVPPTDEIGRAHV